MACQKQLRWYHLVPVFSFIALRGRCAYCGTRISLQYPIVELVTGVAFALVGSVGLPLVPQVLAYIIAALLIVISVYDIRHTIIRDAWVYTFAGVAFLYAMAYMLPQVPFEWVVLVLSGPFVALPLWLMWFFSRGTWMGFGDVKLALGIGWFLGPLYGFVALFGGFILGAVVSVFVLLLLPRLLRAFDLHKFSLGTPSGGFTMKSEVPFGPFLTCSCFIVWYIYTAGVSLPFGFF